MSLLTVARNRLIGLVPGTARPGQGGFQTAEAIGIAAVGLLVLFGIWGAMSALGVDVVEWIRSTFGIGGVPGS